MNDDIICPVCNRSLIRNDMGIRAHLNSHVKKKEITRTAADQFRRSNTSFYMKGMNRGTSRQD